MDQDIYRSGWRRRGRASFGAYFTADDSGVLNIYFGPGVILNRIVTFSTEYSPLEYDVVTDTSVESGYNLKRRARTEADQNFNTTFCGGIRFNPVIKSRVEMIEASSGAFSISDFPLVVCAFDGKLLVTTPEMQSFKELGASPRRDENGVLPHADAPIDYTLDDDEIKELFEKLEIDGANGRVIAKEDFSAFVASCVLPLLYITASVKWNGKLTPDAVLEIMGNCSIMAADSIVGEADEGDDGDNDEKEHSEFDPCEQGDEKPAEQVDVGFGDEQFDDKDDGVSIGGGDGGDEDTARPCD